MSTTRLTSLAAFMERSSAIVEATGFSTRTCFCKMTHTHAHTHTHTLRLYIVPEAELKQTCSLRGHTSTPSAHTNQNTNNKGEMKPCDSWPEQPAVHVIACWSAQTQLQQLGLARAPQESHTGGTHSFWQQLAVPSPPRNLTRTGE